MRRSLRVVGGAAGAAALGFDGFRNLKWPEMWCAPRTARTAPNTFRARDWLPPVQVGGVLVAHPALILRQLSAQIETLSRRTDGIAPYDRLELALEYALHNKLATIQELTVNGGAGNNALRVLIAQRSGEPPTESFAETRFVQFGRTVGIVPWRQLWVQVDGRDDYRIDFVVPFDEFALRPRVFTAEIGVGVEVNSKQYHPLNFERDYQKGSDYDALALPWIRVSPFQIERQPWLVQRAIHGAFIRAGYLPKSPNLGPVMGLSA
jgi:hypothetical protein